MPMPGNKYVYRLVDGDLQGHPRLNGVRVNNQPCSEKLLKTGDLIRIGEKTSLTNLLARISQEDFDAYFRTEELRFRSLKEKSLDPTSTIVWDSASNSKSGA